MGVDGANAERRTMQEVQGRPGRRRWRCRSSRATWRWCKTDAFWDTEAEAVFKKGWRENIDEWNKVGSDYPYHYLGSAKTLCGIGAGERGSAAEAPREIRADPVPTGPAPR